MARWLGRIRVSGLPGCGRLVSGRGEGPCCGKVADANRPRHSRAVFPGLRGRRSPGNWQLVAFDSSYRFRNPQAPYLFPHQAFQYSHRGVSVKSAHSLQPLSGDPDQLFEAVPLDMTYRVEGKGRVVLKTKEHDETVETWSCRVITKDPEGTGDQIMPQRGDLVMTLMGSHGQGLFVRHLRKRAA
jgi:hypothetical protein